MLRFKCKRGNHDVVFGYRIAMALNAGTGDEGLGVLGGEPGFQELHPTNYGHIKAEFMGLSNPAISETPSRFFCWGCKMFLSKDEVHIYNEEIIAKN